MEYSCVVIMQFCEQTSRPGYEPRPRRSSSTFLHALARGEIQLSLQIVCRPSMAAAAAAELGEVCSFHSGGTEATEEFSRSGGVVRNRLEDDDIVDGADDDDDLFVAGGDRKRPCRAHEEREHMGAEDIAGPAHRQPLFPSKEVMAARGLEDMVESLSIGGDKAPWSLFGNSKRRERAFTYAGGRAAEVRQSKLRATELKRTLLRGGGGGGGGGDVCIVRVHEIQSRARHHSGTLSTSTDPALR